MESTSVSYLLMSSAALRHDNNRVRLRAILSACETIYEVFSHKLLEYSSAHCSPCHFYLLPPSLIGKQPLFGGAIFGGGHFLEVGSLFGGNHCRKHITDQI